MVSSTGFGLSAAHITIQVLPDNDLSMRCFGQILQSTQSCSHFLSSFLPA